MVADTFHQRTPFICVLFTHHVSSVKYNKTLKALLLCLYEIYTALGEGLMTNIDG